MSLTSRSEELTARIPRAERAPVIQVSPEEEPEIESFSDRGDRILKEAAARVSATWAGLRSRLSNFGDRLVGATKTGIGASAAGIETSGTIAKRTAGATVDVAANIPRMGMEVGKFVAGEVADLAQGYNDILRPHEAADMEAVDTLDLRIQRIRDVLADIKPGKAYDGLTSEIERLEAEKATLLNTSRRLVGSQTAGKALAAAGSAARKGAGAVGAGIAMGAMGVVEGARSAGAKVEAMREARRQEQEDRRIEHENVCIARAELFLMDAAEASGEPVQNLSKEHLRILGTKLEEVAARRRTVDGLKEMGRTLLYVEDVVEVGQNLASAASDFAAFAKNPKARAEFLSDVRKAGVTIGTALGDAFATVGRKAFVEPAKRGARVAGRTGVAVAKGAAVAGAGLAVAGVEAAANSRAGRAAKKAVVEQWEARKPAIEQGLASGVESLNRFAENAARLPDDVSRMADGFAEQINEEAKEAFGYFDRMMNTVRRAVAVAQRKWNEFMLEVAQEKATSAEQSVRVDEIREAVDIVKKLEEITADDDGDEEEAERSVKRLMAGAR